MKKIIIFLTCLFGVLLVTAQQNLGIRNSNYAGIQGALLNPGSIADSKLQWDVNVISAGEVFANSFLFAPKSSLPFFGVGKIIKGSIQENLFLTHFNMADTSKLYQLSFSTEILGPSFFIKIANKHVVGFTMEERSYANIRNISGNVSQNAFAYLLEKDLWNTPFHDSTARINTMSWLSYGLHYAAVLYNDGKSEWKAGISLNYLQGIGAGYMKNTRLNYTIRDTSDVVFTNSSVDYGRTDLDDYRKKNYNSFNHGHGFGADIGLTYVRLRSPTENEHTACYNEHAGQDNADYIYRIGISLIDLGYINFNRRTAAFHLQTDSADFSNWHQSKFSGNNQFDQALSAVFYHGDSLRSFQSSHFSMSLPTAISIQADWNVYEHFFANLTIVKGFGHGNHPGVVRPDVYSITPRYETLWGEVSLPFSLLYYGLWKPRLGVAFRVGYFFIGGDAPGSLLRLNDLNDVDFYAGIHFFVAEKKKTHDAALFNH